MKIAFTTSGNDLDAPLDSRFGRAPKFIILDPDTGNYEVIENEKNLNAADGAGIKSAETIAKSGAGILITGHCGPKAFRVLTAANVRVYNTEAKTVSEALALYRSGKLKSASSADVESHW